MIKTILLAIVVASAAQADLITIDLLAAFGQGVGTTGTPLRDFVQVGIKGPRSSTMTISGAAANNGTTTYSYGYASEPNASVIGLNITFDALRLTSFTHTALVNDWSFGNAGPSTFTLYGNVSNLAGAPTGYNALFTGTFLDAVDLTQSGGSLGTITQVGDTSLHLIPTAAGLQFIQSLTPGNYQVSSATLQGLEFRPNTAVGSGGGFSSTAANFLGGQLVLVTATPEPATFLTIGLAGLAFGLVRLRRR